MSIVTPFRVGIGIGSFAEIFRGIEGFQYCSFEDLILKLQLKNKLENMYGHGRNVLRILSSTLFSLFSDAFKIPDMLLYEFVRKQNCSTI